MFAQDYLNLRLVRLKPADGWTGPSEGFSFIFLKGGVGKYLAGPHAKRLGIGDVLVAGAEVRGKLCAANGEDLVFWAFALCVEHLFPLFAGDEISMLHTVVDGFNGPKVYSASTPLAKECQRLLAQAPPQFNLDHRSHLLRVAAVILNEEFKLAQHARAGFVRVEDHLLQVFEKLSSDDLLTSSVGELAAKFSCSRRHLNRLFHHYFGFSVAALRMEMRLLKAISLLRDPGAKIVHVAEQCGFNHLGLFNTCFKKRFSVSPGQWRKGVLPPEAQPGEGKAEGKSENPECPLRSKGLCPWAGGSDQPTAPVSNLRQRVVSAVLREPSSLMAGASAGNAMLASPAATIPPSAGQAGPALTTLPLL